MSDKNRNMNDINDQKTAEQQAFSEEIRRRLAEPGSGKPTLDEFKVMVYKDREKRRKKRNALVACIVAAFIVGYLTYDDLVPEVGADKNPKETIQTEDGVIIEDGGWGSSEEKEGVYIIDNWEHISDAALIEPNILIPEYIPSGYHFEQLTIERFEKDNSTSEYLFANQEENVMEIEIVVFKNDSISTDINNIKQTIESEKGTIYIQGENKNKRATILMDDGISIYIWGELSDFDILKIVEKLRG